jgi:hypothetical protein
MSAETRAQVLGAVQARYGAAEDPVARLSAWVDRCGLFAADEPAPRLVARALIEGADLPEVLARLRAAFPEAAVAAQQDDVAAFCEGSIFSALRA